MWYFGNMEGYIVQALINGAVVQNPPREKAGHSISRDVNEFSEESGESLPRDIQAPDGELSQEDIQKQIEAWDSYERLKIIHDITWEDVADLRRAIRQAPQFKEDYSHFKERFRMLGYRYEEVITQSDAYIETYGYPADMSLARVAELENEYVTLRTRLIQEVLQYDEKHCTYIRSSSECRGY
jgi:hypothetical protein